MFTASSNTTAPWFDNGLKWVRRHVSGLNGDTSGASGDGPKKLCRAWLVIVAALMLCDIVGASSAIRDIARMGLRIEDWQPGIWYASSFVAELAVAWVVWRALLIARPGRDPALRLVAVHILASAIFSVVHVMLMVALRHAAYHIVGRHYAGGFDWVYEYRKDVLGYLLIASVFLRCSGKKPQTANLYLPEAESTARPVFDILEGNRLVRTPVSSIMSVQAAGNYVEFTLDDERCLLMRSSLKEIEAKLAPHGLVRTHRSWLVGPSHVREINRTRSGDYEITLKTGRAIPLSRRSTNAQTLTKHKY
ncbi:LytTR family DNA-binding domain-containing protein [Brytella acorum]|uniref:LytTR family DNA-binding domain-containing protein n=1 Tax=Brytella acorum TaxID=2959299 RepID=A0AA35VCS5_9PROT|nr:LytTR family DNA-binding domain-containing protein [Brytella acorum]CAI9121798.1 LytTR family DNA-binding domain-containing protein [Brytella acorum]